MSSTPVDPSMHVARACVRPERQALLLFVAGMCLVLASFSPFRIRQMGYTPEILDAGRQLLDGWTGTGEPHDGQTLKLPRHGAGELAAAMPFLAAARLAFGPSEVWADRVLSLQPILATALICGILFVWTARLAGSLQWGLVLGLLGCFSTILWPYAYISLETTQSLFLLCAAFLAFEGPSRTSWKRCVLFAGCGAVAVSIKAASLFLLPALAWSTWCLVHRGPETREERRRMLLQIAAIAAIAALAWSLNTWTRFRFWHGVFTVQWLVRGPLDFVLQVWAALTGLNKGLLVFCPILLAAFARLEVAYSRNMRVVTFAVLTLAGQLLGTCLLTYWSEETWGPRYLHSSVGPLILCIALAKAGRPFRLRREWPLLGLGGAGLMVSALGSLFWFGYLFHAARPQMLSTLENYQYDFAFNHIRFNASLARVWLDGGRSATPELWPPPQIVWYYPKGRIPARFKPRQPASLAPFAVPQPLVLQRNAGPRWPFLVAVALGLTALGWVAWRLRPGGAANGGSDDPVADPP